MHALVCIDIDGTLVGSTGAVRPAVWAAAERARAHGIRLAVCTGRPAFGRAREYAERLDDTGWHIFQNGASVVQLPGGRTQSRRLPPDAVAQLIRRARASGRVLELYSDTAYAVESTLPRARQHAALLGVPFAPCALDAFAGGVVRAQWVLPHADVASVMTESHDGLTLAASLSPMMPDTTFLNATAQGVDKGSALRAVALAYGVPLHRVMMVGDSDNDVGAMAVAGVPVAMGNAHDVVRAAAKHVVGHVNDDGLADALALAMTL